MRRVKEEKRKEKEKKNSHKTKEKLRLKLDKTPKEVSERKGENFFIIAKARIQKFTAVGWQKSETFTGEKRERREPVERLNP